MFAPNRALPKLLNELISNKRRKIASIGYGAIGKLIHTLAVEKGDENAVVINDADADLSATIKREWNLAKAWLHSEIIK